MGALDQKLVSMVDENLNPVVFVEQYHSGFVISIDGAETTLNTSLVRKDWHSMVLVNEAQVTDLHVYLDGQLLGSVDYSTGDQTLVTQGRLKFGDLYTNSTVDLLVDEVRVSLNATQANKIAFEYTNQYETAIENCSCQFGILDNGNNTVTAWHHDAGWSASFAYLCLNGACYDASKVGNNYERDFASAGADHTYAYEFKVQDNTVGQFIKQTNLKGGECLDYPIDSIDENCKYGSYRNGDGTITLFHRDMGWTGNWAQVCKDGLCYDAIKEDGYYKKTFATEQTNILLEIKVQDNATGQYLFSAHMAVGECVKEAPTGSTKKTYGIWEEFYHETATFPWNSGGYLGLWGGTTVNEEYSDVGEGTKSLRVDFSAGQGGMFFDAQNVVDMFVYNSGFIKFWIKGTSDATVRIERASGDAYELQLSNYASLSGNWEEVAIPISDFGVTLTDMKVLFGLHNGSGVYYLDELRWESE